MSYILKEKFRMTTRYIYMVEYDQKKGEDYEVITRVSYFRWDSEEQQFVKRNWDTSHFAKALYNQEFRCYAGKETSDRLVDVVEVEAYRQDDGEYWIRSKANDTTDDNLEFLTYAKLKGFAKKA
ncbi:MAG: DUF3892 domain-containing protein [Bacteroidaceae bacterium]|nr:DUF3892 domain-containing protein [Bacteroidaceae bacterium]